jgi:hypothetical protein
MIGNSSFRCSSARPPCLVLSCSKRTMSDRELGSWRECSEFVLRIFLRHPSGPTETKNITFDEEIAVRFPAVLA